MLISVLIYPLTSAEPKYRPFVKNLLGTQNLPVQQVCPFPLQWGRTSSHILSFCLSGQHLALPHHHLHWKAGRPRLKTGSPKSQSRSPPHLQSRPEPTKVWSFSGKGRLSDRKWTERKKMLLSGVQISNLIVSLNVKRCVCTAPLALLSPLISAYKGRGWWCCRCLRNKNNTFYKLHTGNFFFYVILNWFFPQTVHLACKTEDEIV